MQISSLFYLKKMQEIMEETRGGGSSSRSTIKERE
jgi:hypothetical protein